MTRAAKAALLTGSLVLVSPAARAQPRAASPSASDNRAIAETLFFTARGLMEAGRVSEACTKFGESYRIDPAAGTLLNLAVCHEKEGKVASAWGEFRQAAVDARKAGRKDREKLAKERVKALEPQLPMLTLDVPVAMRVKGLEVSRGGVALQAASWGLALPTDPGDVEIVARAPGYLPKTTTVHLAKAQHASVALEPLELAPPPPPVAVVEPGWSSTRAWGAGVFLAGVAAAGVGTYFGVSAVNARKRSDAECPEQDGERRCTAVGVDEMNKANTLAWGANIAFGASLVALGVGTYLFFAGANAAPEAKAPAVARSSVRWSPSLSPRGGGLGISGSF
jgi:hypothetical protein